MMASSILTQIKAIDDYEKRLEAIPIAVSSARGGIGDLQPLFGDPDGPQQGQVLGYRIPNDSGQDANLDPSYVRMAMDSDGDRSYSFDRASFMADKVGEKPKGDKAQLLKQALAEGIDLRPIYGDTYEDSIRFKKDLGLYAGKDSGMIPANPLGYNGEFKFDPNFGSSFYRDLAFQSGRALGLPDDQILKKGTEFFADKFATGTSNKGAIGFTDFGSGLLDTFATTAGVPAERLPELRSSALKPLYDANQQLFSSLNQAAKVESNSSGFFKGLGAKIQGLGPLGTIALGALLGPAGLGLGTATAGAVAGALPGALQGDLSSALKGGAIGGIGGGALKGLDGVSGVVSEALGGGTLGDIAGSAVTGGLKGGIGSLATGNDLRAGLLGGALSGGASAGIQSALNSANKLLTDTTKPDVPLGSGVSADSTGLGLVPPKGFDIAPSVGNDLPSTLGFVGSVPGIGGLFDNMEFSSSGLSPAPNSFGEGLKLPSLPTLSGSLGQGLSVNTPSGTLGQSGIARTGAVLGSPGSIANGGAAAPEAGSGVDVGKAIRALLGAGGATALAGGIGGLSGGSRFSSDPGSTQQGPSQLALRPSSLNRDLGFQFQTPQYTAGLSPQAVQLPQYDVINPQANPTPSYVRGFSEGGAIQAVNGGLGSVPMDGRFLVGPGDGMSDNIPANIDGEEEVMLTDGEYIVPAQAVSALGNGSSKAGAQVLDSMVKRVYQQQTGKPKQMKPISENVLPA